jgi:hypothetical protein
MHVRHALWPTELLALTNGIITLLREKRKSACLDLPIAPSDGIMENMNKGYAFGFLIVVLVVILGMYVAFTGFVSSREAIRTQPTSPPGTRVVRTVPVPTNPPPTATATLLVIPTPLPGETITPTVEASVDVTEPPPAQPTEPPPAQPTDSPTPAVPPPTPVPIQAYQFRLGGPPTADPGYPSCCYIFGVVRDAAGNGLEGVRVQVGNEWNPPVVAVSKGGVDLGKYDVPIGRDAVAWYVSLIDAEGNQISSQVQIQFDPNVANAYRVDWQRTY